MNDVPTLAWLADELNFVLRVIEAPRGLDVAIHDAVIYDSQSDVVAGVGDLLLAVGVDVGSTEAVRIIERAGRVGASVVLFKMTDGPARLSDAAVDAGVALVATSNAMSWGELHGLLRTALAARWPPPQETEPLPIGDLFALADAVATMVGGATTIEDPQSNLLAYSRTHGQIDDARRQTILGRRVPADRVRRLQEDGIFRKLWSTDGVVRYGGETAEDVGVRLAVAVRAGSEILGSIWVAPGSEALPSNAEEALLKAADIASLHLVRHSMNQNVLGRRRSDGVRSLLEGRLALNSAELSERGIDIGLPAAVVAFKLQATEEAELAVNAQRCVDLIALYCGAFRRTAHCVVLDSTVYVVLPDLHAGERQQLVELAHKMVQHVHDGLHMDIRAAIGSTVETVREIPRSKREVDQILRVEARRPSGAAVIDIDDVRSQTILLELQDLAARHPTLLIGKLQTLIDHDRERNTDYVETLRAYLDSFGSIATAAGIAHVHENTFRYRMKRLVELSGVDLQNSEERLVIALQLHLISQ